MRVELDSIYDSCSRLRDLINGPRRSAQLRRSLDLWYQLCAGLDVIEDSQLAIDADCQRKTAEVGERYLALFGVLQALFVQQTALKHVSEALEIELTHEPQSLMARIREIRNDSIGHPSKSIRGSDRSYHFVSRPFLHADSFQILSFGSAGQQVRDVPLRKLLGEQRLEMLSYLENLETTLREQDEEHRRQFRSRPLAATFPSSLAYELGKISEAKTHPEMREFACICLGQIEDTLSDLRGSLEERDAWDALDSIRWTFEAIEWPLRRLKAIYSGGLAHLGPDEASLVEVCLYSVDGHLRELRSLVAELDESYAQD